jgi:leader peptidase (prepilin peptidase)/N-methyltransferase
LGVVATRHDALGSALIGRSACDTCGTTLDARDLVPVLSWAASRGRCRHCGAAVGWFYPAIEICALAVALWSSTVFSGAAFWISCCLGWTLVALAATDFKYLMLPDFLTLPLVALGLAANWFLDPATLSAHMIGAALGFGAVMALRFLYERLRRREGMGVGDAKLLAAAGAWTSWEGLPSVLAIAAVSALIFALLRGARARRLSLVDSVPFGPFLAGGLWIVWLYGPLTFG